MKQMKYDIFKKASQFAVVFFLCFWLTIFIFSISGSNIKQLNPYDIAKISKEFSAWKFFTPPFTFNLRLYYITSDTTNASKTDTLEVLERIALRKQQHAPFNQKENIVDHLVNNSVNGLLRSVWIGRKMQGDNIPSIPDSLFLTTVIASAEKDKNYLRYLSTIKNYGITVLKENDIDSKNKRIKIVISQMPNIPFNEIHNKKYIQKETVIFETFLVDPIKSK